jgi:hypothetical protein
LDLRRIRRCLEGNVAEERVDGGETKVPRSRRHVPNLLQYIEEINHQGRVDILERQRRWRPAQPFLCKLQQQPKRVAVGSNRVGARLSLLHQPPCEEAFQQCRETRLARHDDSPQRRSSRAIACAISSGQLLRYQ